MSIKLIDCEEVETSEQRTKFDYFNSPEKAILTEYFNTMPMMDNWIANLIESYVYAFVNDLFEFGGNKHIVRYRTKYGVMDGEYKCYYNNGNLAAEYTYKEGKLIGEGKDYYEDGNIKVECTFEDDISNFKAYYNNGSVWVIRTRINDILNGEYIEYWNNGNIKIHAVFRDGKKEGEYTEFYIGGEKRLKCYFIDGKKEGICEEWYPEGTKLRVCNYKDDNMHGEYTEWYGGEIIKQKATYEEGRRTELMKWSINGQLLEYSTF